MDAKGLARRLKAHYLSHGVALKINKLHVKDIDGSIIFKVLLKKGARERKFFECSSDIQLALSLPFLQPFKREHSLYLAVHMIPFTRVELLQIIESDDFRCNDMWIPVPLGRDMLGSIVMFDLGKAPHVLYAGATNSGKSVGLNVLIIGISMRLSASRINLVIIDVCSGGFEGYQKLPHLSCPVIRSKESAISAILAIRSEMERRAIMSDEDLYRHPAIILVVDEYLALISRLDKGDERKIFIDVLLVLLRSGRHAKIHVVLATHEPMKSSMQLSIDNITSRIAFACSSMYNSMAVLGERGAEKLQGNGAMFFKKDGATSPVYVQGAYIDDHEIESLIDDIALYPHDTSLKFVIPVVDDNEIFVDMIESIVHTHVPDSRKQELAKIALWVLGNESTSASQIEQKFRIGRRSSGIINELYDLGIVTERFANQPRKVLPQSMDDLSPEAASLFDTCGHSIDEVEEMIHSRRV